MKTLPILLLSTLLLNQAFALPGVEERFRKDTESNPSFRRHVIPMMSRNGCSGRECHGSFQGRGDFQLSLFGYDFDMDHKNLTADAEHEIRVDTEKPEQSLALLKATTQEKHKGKKRFDIDSWEYKMMLAWIRGGAKNDAKEVGDIVRLEVAPAEIVFKAPGERVQLSVHAHWEDGTVENVTALTRFRTNDESVAEIDKEGWITCINKGDTHIVAFYDNGLQPIPVMLPLSDRTGKRYPDIAPSTKVDELVLHKLKKVGIVPSETCSDTAFLRRASLDVTGTLPSPDEIRAFTKNDSPGKRKRKIDELLERPGYAAWWSTKFCDFTGNNARNIQMGQVRGDFSGQWYDWVYKRISENVPYDELVAGIVLARSRTSPEQGYLDYAKEMSSYFKKDHPVSFAERKDMPYYWARRNFRKPEEKSMGFAHNFLGVRIQCAQCHKHPFDQWTQDDFKSFQAFFEPVQFGSGYKGGKMMMMADAKGAGSYGQLQDQIRKQVGYTRDKKDNTKDKQKAFQQELQRRMDAGEPVPWQEITLNIRTQRKLSAKEIAKRRKRDPKFSARVITPKILGGEEVMMSEYSDPREPLMAWLRDPGNPYFARAFVNRLWAHYFGRGIVEPADDMNLANPPSNRPLIDYLAKGFVDSGFDMKWLHREILNSEAYQRSWEVNETNRLDERNFSHMVLRRLPAEVVTDAIAMATLGKERAASFRDEVHTRAIGPVGSGYRKTNNKGGTRGVSTYALGLFGAPVRETNCDCERSEDPTLLQTIYTRNDPDLLGRVNGSIDRKDSWMSELGATLQSSDPKMKYRVANLKRQLQGLDRKEAAYAKQKPRKPKTDDPAALRKYKAAMNQWQQRMNKGGQYRKSLKKQLAQVEPKKATPSEERDIGELIDEVYLRTVSRLPSDAEKDMARGDIAAADNPLKGIQDLLWVMLNTKEFMVNH